MRIRAISGSIRRGAKIRASSRWISASWVRWPSATSTGSPRISWRCSTATTGASPNCISPRAGCRRTSASTNSKPRCARCASRISRGRCREISLGEVVVKMFQVARSYELTLQPQLILLQKTLLNIEGIGRSLHPQIDIWAVAQPVLADILRRRYGIAPHLARTAHARARMAGRRAADAGADSCRAEESRRRRIGFRGARRRAGTTRTRRACGSASTGCVDARRYGLADCRVVLLSGCAQRADRACGVDRVG